MHDIDDVTRNLELDAEQLRLLHVAGDPLVLVNVWDAASAGEVAAAGAAALGTSSAAIAATLGEPDDNTMAIAEVFGRIKRIAAAAPLPVTADVEGGYDLAPSELVGALLAAGAVGCNLEDSDHRRPGRLLDTDVMAERLSAVRKAADGSGVDLVVNARVDVLRHLARDRAAAHTELVRRARRYLDAGADCVFPIGVGDPQTAGVLIDAIGGPVNVGLGRGVTVAEMAAAGASRVSVGPTLHRRAMAELRERAATMLAGGPAAL
jgi:2-methylisocitrate lyase-like PEP mutase family enzyme